MSLLDDILERVTNLDEESREALVADVIAATGDKVWLPQPGPQSEAYFSQADELFYGGQAGGGKTDLGLGLALTEHTNSLILRRQAKEASKLFQRIEGILGHTDGRNMGAASKWEINGKTLDIGGCQREDDKQKFKGIPHDLIFFDEIPDFLKSQYEFIRTWNRSTIPGQRCRVVCAGNPPTTPEGLWVIEYWGPWLDPKHPNPAKDGELRWFVVDKYDKTHEVEGAGPHVIVHEDGSKEEIRARSRTFIRAKLTDNAYLKDTDYAATLDSLPAEIRAAYRDGSFDKSIKDDPWQIIPTAWVQAAQARWTPNAPNGVPMCAIGVDVAQGGEDNSVLAPRYDGWYDQTISIPGKQTPLGSDLAAVVIAKSKNGAIAVVDMGGGYGGGVIQALPKGTWVAYKGSESSHERTKDGKIGFKNKRTAAYWKFREALDPDQPGGSPIMLPPNARLLSDLTAVKFRIENNIIIAENKVDVVDRLGRSPDDGDAVVMAWTDGGKGVTHGVSWGRNSLPKVNMGHDSKRRRR